MKVKVLASRGQDDFLVDAGTGDALGQKNVQLGRVFSFRLDRYLLDKPLPVSSIVARGYWDDAKNLPDRADIESRIESALLDHDANPGVGQPAA